jgi:hypothetical protein
MNPKDVHKSTLDMTPKERLEFYMKQHYKFKTTRPPDIVTPPKELSESDGGMKRKKRTPRQKKPKVSVNDL